MTEHIRLNELITALENIRHEIGNGNVPVVVRECGSECMICDIDCGVMHRGPAETYADRYTVNIEVQ